MRIAVCGLHLEASQFTPHRSTAADFEVRRGAEVLARYDWLEAAWACDVVWVGVLHARALPGGPLVADDYAAWEAEILDGLSAAGPLDGVLLDIHGAMSVVGMVDVEGVLAGKVRDVVGPEAFISAAMDLHGNVSPALFAACDLLTCYRTAPHVDVWETRERAARNLVTALRTGLRPAKALRHVPILLPGEMTSTRDEPAASLYARLPEIEARVGITDAALWVGFAWADEPRCSAAVVVTGRDQATVDAAADELALQWWDVRHDFRFVAPTGTFDECLAAALASEARPFFISDSGDNPGAGGADDVTHALARVIASPQARASHVVVASLLDPAAVAAAEAAGLGAGITVHVGGHLDTREPPVLLDARVGALADCPEGGRVARLDVGGVQVVVTSRRSQYATLDMYHRLGIDPAAADVVVVKIGYLEPELHAIAAGWLLSLTPGGVDQDLRRLGHRHIPRPMIPFDDDAPPPQRQGVGRD